LGEGLAGVFVQMKHSAIQQNIDCVLPCAIKHELRASLPQRSCRSVNQFSRA